MTPDLLAALELFLREQLQDCRLGAKHNERLVSPHVFVGAIPPEWRDEESYPCVVLRWASSSDGLEENEERIDLLVGVYEPDAAQSEYWLAQIASHIRLLLQEHPIQGGRFKLAYPIKTEPAATAERQREYHVCVVKTVWTRSMPPQPVEGFEL